MPRRAGLVIAITIYSRPGCHLCDDMKALVTRVAGAMRSPVAIEDVDISTDADLEARYGLEIPVLVVNGRKVAKYRVREEELRKILEGRKVEGEG
jgi:glutaredoxin